MVCLYFGLDYFKQQQAQAEIMTSVNTANRTLIKVQRPVENLSERLNEVKQAYETASTALSEDAVNSTEIIKSIYQAADEFNLRADPLTAGPWSKKVIDGSIYQIMPLVLNIEGRPASLLLFIEKMENKVLFPVLAIENISVADKSELNNEAVIIRVRAQSLPLS